MVNWPPQLSVGSACQIPSVRLYRQYISRLMWRLIWHDWANKFVFNLLNEHAKSGNVWDDTVLCNYVMHVALSDITNGLPDSSSRYLLICQLEDKKCTVKMKIPFVLRERPVAVSLLIV